MMACDCHFKAAGTLFFWRCESFFWCFVVNPDS
jgi:hypothetical protein